MAAEDAREDGGIPRTAARRAAVEPVLSRAAFARSLRARVVGAQVVWARVFGPLAASTAFLALAACASPGPAGGTAARPAPAPAPPAVLTEKAAVAPGTLLAAEQMVGLSDAEVTGLFGRPSLFRADSPAELWQYASGECVLLVFLREGPGGEARVLHAETQGIAPAQCLRRLIGRAANARADRGDDEAAEASPGA